MTTLAPSPRVAAYLARKGLGKPPSMSLVVAPSFVDRDADSHSYDATLKPPPDVAVTPADRWPRPYYIEDNLRKVHPYHFTYNTNVKERWRGRQLLDIFSSEFRDRPLPYYVKSASTTMEDVLTRNSKMRSRRVLLL